MSRPEAEKKWIATGELNAEEMAFLRDARQSNEAGVREAIRVLVAAGDGQYEGDPRARRVMRMRTLARFKTTSSPPAKK